MRATLAIEVSAPASGAAYTSKERINGTLCEAAINSGLSVTLSRTVWEDASETRPECIGAICGVAPAYAFEAKTAIKSCTSTSRHGFKARLFEPVCGFEAAEDAFLFRMNQQVTPLWQV